MAEPSAAQTAASINSPRRDTVFSARWQAGAGAVPASNQRLMPKDSGDTFAMPASCSR